jgi:hypothetical protein
MIKLTPAQKAKRTKLERQYWAEYEQAMESVNEDFYGFCRTLYPERDAKIAAAEEKMNQIIADAQAEFQAIRSAAQSLVEDHPEVLRLDKVRAEFGAAQTKILFEKIEAIQI